MNRWPIALALFYHFTNKFYTMCRILSSVVSKRADIVYYYIQYTKDVFQRHYTAMAVFFHIRKQSGIFNRS